MFEYRLAPTYDFRMELLSNGADVEVLRPAWFREEVKNVVTKMRIDMSEKIIVKLRRDNISVSSCKEGVYLTLMRKMLVLLSVNIRR